MMLGSGWSALGLLVLTLASGVGLGVYEDNKKRNRHHEAALEKKEPPVRSDSMGGRDFTTLDIAPSAPSLEGNALIETHESVQGGQDDGKAEEWILLDAKPLGGSANQRSLKGESYQGTDSVVAESHSEVPGGTVSRGTLSIQKDTVPDEEINSSTLGPSVSQARAGTNPVAIAKMLQHAEVALNKRNYEMATTTAKNILLFDPSNTRAKEIIEKTSEKYRPNW